MNEKINRFMQKQTCAGICCLDEKGNPYCFSCFYVFNPEKVFLYFKSSASSRHASLLNKSPYVAGTIQPDKLNTITIKGIQFEGKIVRADDFILKQAIKKYHLKFPMAIAIPGEIWIIQLENIKMTDSTIGFGKKIFWNRNEQMVTA
jgi:uncharacterized protein